MAIKRYIDRVQYLDYLIRTRATGTPEELARKLGLSKRAWFELRSELVEEFDFPIAYCPYRQSYYYTRSGNFRFGFTEPPRDEVA
jgi:hypothetical protein